MIMHPGLLYGVADNAGIKVPPIDEMTTYEMEDYPHWHVYFNLQLGASLPNADQHFVNAELIASIPDDRIKLITGEEMIQLGVR